MAWKLFFYAIFSSREGERRTSIKNVTSPSSFLLSTWKDNQHSINSFANWSIDRFANHESKTFASCSFGFIGPWSIGGRKWVPIYIYILYIQYILWIYIVTFFIEVEMRIFRWRQNGGVSYPKRERECGRINL